MINKLDEKLRKYSHKYFVREFMKSKPNAKYKKLKNKSVLAFGCLCVLIVMLTLSGICDSQLGVYWYWYSLSLFFCLIICAFCLRELVCRMAMVLSEMASAYLDDHEDLKGKMPNYSLLTTWTERMQYISAIENTYRSEIVKRCLGNDCNISTIMALKNEINVKDVKFDLGFISVCSLGALSISLAAWKESNIQQGWPIAVLSFFILLLCYGLCQCRRVVKWNFKRKKYKILRETLSFMLYDYM